MLICTLSFQSNLIAVKDHLNGRVVRKVGLKSESEYASSEGEIAGIYALRLSSMVLRYSSESPITVLSAVISERCRPLTSPGS